MKYWIIVAATRCLTALSLSALVSSCATLKETDDTVGRNVWEVGSIVYILMGH